MDLIGKDEDVEIMEKEKDVKIIKAFWISTIIKIYLLYFLFFYHPSLRIFNLIYNNM